MALIHKIIKGGSNLFNSLKPDNKQQILELEKLEKQLEKQKKEVDKTVAPFVFTNRMFIKFRAFGMIIIFIGLFVYKSLGIIYLIFMAYVISLAVEAIIDFLQKYLRYRGLSIVLAYLFILVVLLGAMVFIIPFFLNQLSDIIKLLIANVSQFQSLLETKSLVGIVQDIHWIPGGLKS